MRSVRVCFRKGFFLRLYFCVFEFLAFKGAITWGLGTPNE